MHKKTVTTKEIGFSIAGLLLAVPIMAFTFATSPEYEAKVKQAESQYEAAVKLCDVKSGNDKDVCLAQAKARETTAKAEAKAAEIATPKAKNEALIQQADAELEVAKEKCDRLTDNAKDVCLKRAALTHEEAVSTVKANQKVQEAQQEALDNISKANYELALQKCDALLSEAKASCIKNVKATFAR